MARKSAKKDMTDEQKRNIKIDINNIPDWNNELKRIISELNQIDWEKILTSVKIIIITQQSEEPYSRYYTILPHTPIKKDEIQLLEFLAAGHQIEWNIFQYFGIHNILNSTAQKGALISEYILSRTTAIQNDIAISRKHGVTQSRIVSIFTKKIHKTTLNNKQLELNEWSDYLIISQNMINARNLLLNAIQNLENNYSKIEKLQNNLHLAKEKSEAIAKFENKYGRSLAKAACLDKTTRTRVNKIKIIIDKQKNCPYCNTLEMQDAHLDHIYPVSKGGLSIIENLVWCCANCNSRKSNKGLVEFLIENGYPLEIVLSRLRSLGKHI